MDIKPTFDHFLIYSNNLESDFRRFRERFDFPILFPVTNYGSFSSGMFACENSILELVSYDNPSLPKANNSERIWFSGFALRSEIIIENLQIYFETNNLNTSDIITQCVNDKDGKNIPISKVILINDILEHFQIFYIQYINNFLESKFLELSKISKWKIINFNIDVEDTEFTKNHFQKIGFAEIKNSSFSDKRDIEFNLNNSNSKFPVIKSFYIKSKEEIINLIDFFL